MRCDEFENALQRQLDGVPVAFDDESLREHAGGCESCRELQEGTRLLVQCFASKHVPPVPIGLADRICAVSQRNPDRSRTYRFAWLAAAVILGAVGLGIRWLTIPQDPSVTVVQRSVIQEQLAQQETLFPELAGPDVMDTRASIPIMVAVEPVSRLFQAVGRSLGDPVRPIAVSTSEAMSNLIKELPDTDVPTIPIPMMGDMMGTMPSKKMPSMGPSS